MNLIIKGGHIVDPKGKKDEVLDLHLADGKIKEIGKNISAQV